MSLDVMKQALSAIEFADMYIKEIVTGSTNRIVAENLLRESGKALRAAIEQAPWVKTYAGGKPNYTVPEKRPRHWQELTDEERHEIREWQRIQTELGPVWAPMLRYLYEVIEAKLKEKNNG